eukprot:14269569-Alexandrium_andersonii.AAC.1
MGGRVLGLGRGVSPWPHPQQGAQWCLLGGPFPPCSRRAMADFRAHRAPRAAGITASADWATTGP